MARIVFDIKTSGTPFESVTDWDKEIEPLTTELTDEEEKSPYAKYYYRKLRMPSKENMLACEGDQELPEKYGVYPDDFPAFMDSPIVDEIPSGYRLLPDGRGYSVARIVMEGITDEKLDYFNKNFNPEGDLFYKCWYPGLHVKHYVHGAIEDVGTGFELIQFISGYNYEMYTGKKYEDVKDPLFIELEGGGGWSAPLHNHKDFGNYHLQVCYWRYLPGKTGRELFVCFWHDTKWAGDHAEKTTPDGQKSDLKDVRALFNHSVWEFTQAAYLVEKFWEDNH